MSGSLGKKMLLKAPLTTGVHPFQIIGRYLSLAIPGTQKSLSPSSFAMGTKVERKTSRFLVHICLKIITAELFWGKVIIHWYNGF